MSMEEITVWRETASMRDFYVNPKHWVLTLLTLGIYAGIVYLVRYYTRYRLTNQRLIKESGLLGRRIDEIELYRIRDTRLHQPFLQRLVGMGDVEVHSADVSGSFRIENLPGAAEKREQIRSLSNEAKEARGVRTVINE
jgi:uncharacterized membrane protein YdbT with pleckstrin-like domain